MIQSIQNKKRAKTSLVVAPITRAVRAALAASAVFALSAGVAHAGARPDAAPAVHGCVGGAIAPVAASPAPVDLTRVACDAPPSSVVASVAEIAWGDDIATLTQIDNGTDIHVSGFGSNVHGLYAVDDSVTIVNGADITADAAALYAGDYVAAIGVRAVGDDVEVRNDAYGLLGAMANSDGGSARARAVYATGFFDNVTVDNDGAIQSRAVADAGRADAHGIYAFGYGSGTLVDNAGDIDVSAQAHGGFAYATGITAIGYGSGDHDSIVANTGSIDAVAEAAYAYAFGILNLTRQSDGSAHFTNDGDIRAEATGDLATATGALDLALRYGTASTVNTGTVEAVATGTTGGSATGLYTYANVYDAAVDNSGVVTATATGGMALATGIDASSSLYGATYVVNSGDVAAHADATTGFASAAGLVAASEKAVDVTNEGSIDAIARAVDGAASAMGMYGSGVETTTMRNYGDVGVLAESMYGDAMAYGVFEFAGYAGIGVVINGGELHATASAGVGAQAHATGINAVGDVISVFNDVNASATATAGDGGLADARAARAYGMYTAVSNYGALDASASVDGGIATARGADSLGMLGSTIYNAGDIAASANASGGEAAAFGTYSVGVSSDAITTNHGTISAQASGDAADAYGVLNASAYYGEAITTNTGSISAIATGGVAAQGEEEAIAFGVYNFALLYDSVVDNSGSIYAAAVATADISGTMGFLQAKAVGAEALSIYGYGDAVVANSGDIDAVASTSQGYASAWGAAVQSTGMYGGASLIDNTGTISAHSQADVGVAYATGAYAINVAADAQVVNHGDISAIARSERGIPDVSVNYAYAVGVKDISQYGTAGVANYGSISAVASSEGAITGAIGVQIFGAYTSVTNAGGASITAIGEVDLFGGGFATGIEASGTYRVDVVNAGDIVVYGHAHAHNEGDAGHYGAARAIGIDAVANMQGDVLVTNTGDIIATALAEDSLSFAQGGAGAVGISTYAKYDATIVNGGDIFATAETEFGITAAYGAMVRGKYTGHFVNQAGNMVYASATVGSSASDAYGGRAVAFGSHMFGNGMEQGVSYNAGTIIARATSTADGGANTSRGHATAWGSAIGAYSNVSSGEMVNHGDIEASADAEFGYATAFGTYVLTQRESATSNAGRIHASATADHGDAFAVGSYAYSLHATVTYPCDDNGCDYSNPTTVVDGGQAQTDNSGTITAAALAEGGVGRSYGVVAIGAQAAGIANTGTISADTEADEASAIGALANSFYGGATLTNGGDILATATGAISTDATGALVRGAYGAQLDNTGRILAGAYGAEATAIAVQMSDVGGNVLTNTGTIAAFGDGARIAVSSGSGASASIVNGGTLVGAVVTGDLDDSLDNAEGATWLAVGESNFGGGDDHVVNHGMLAMDDATIRLGGHAAGNLFENFGTLAVSGDANLLDIGNAFPVLNDGTISFVDGAPDDMLTIVGDFAGEGAIQLDASLLHQAGDLLYIDGNVIASTTQVLDVNLVDGVSAPSVEIPLVQVGGDALAANFALGQVQQGGGFLSMDYRLTSHIDAANATPDLVSLGIDVTGLNGMGSLAAAIAPGVQGLVDAQTGTWRQRMGVVPRESGDVGLAPWVRVFSGSGDVALGHAGNFGAGGHFGFDQSNQGWEIGIDSRPGEHFAFGLLFADADGTQHVDGAGSDRFDGKTFGLYGTWFGHHGWYVDTSVRWVGIDARLRAATGEHRAKASAASFNVETGFTAWTTNGGLNVVPQAQYTRTRIADITPMEANQSEFVGDGGLSSRGRLGVALDTTFEGAGFTWTPYGSLNAIHEFDGEYDYVVNGGLVGSTRTDGTSAMVEMGLGARKGGLSITGGFHWTDGGAMQSVFGGQVIVRYSW